MRLAATVEEKWQKVEFVHGFDEKLENRCRIDETLVLAERVGTELYTAYDEKHTIKVTKGRLQHVIDALAPAF